MGACTFVTGGKGKTAEEAFGNAVRQAEYDYGHSGYTGSIAEKTSFIMINDFGTVKPDEAYDKAIELIDKGDGRIDDKWGDAGCFYCGDDCYCFFGWASE